MKTNESNVLVYVGGVSGSRSPSFSRPQFGHNTTSFGIAYQGYGIIIDNGTGVPNVVSFLKDHDVHTIDILQTHPHGDHISGIHNNGALFQKDLVKKFFAPRLLSGKAFSDIFASMFEKDIWPPSPKDAGSNISIEEFDPTATSMLSSSTLILSSGWHVKTLLQNHSTTGSVGYRIETPCGAIVISTDSEPVSYHAHAMECFIDGAETVLIDMQYRDEEYAGELGICDQHEMKRSGWGHGTPSLIHDVYRLCEKVPERTRVIHHDPDRSDIDLRVMEIETFCALQDTIPHFAFAREGDVYEI